MADRTLTRSEKNKIIKRLGLGAGILIGAIVILLVIFKLTSVGSNEKVKLELPDGAIEVDGKTYVPKKNIETYLFMGIDNDGKVEKVTDYNGAGRCDVVILVVRDKTTGTFKTLNINRNILMEQDSLKPDGTYLGTSTCILALAHENGDGMEISCENVVKTVSNFLGGQKIDGYAALNMGGIAELNHLAAGVTVTIGDDFSQIDPSLKLGETITLNDEQAKNFVHSRWYVDDGTNESRMRRHTAYINGLKTNLKEKCMADANYAVDVYDGLSDYMVTNMPKSKFTKLAELMIKDRDEGELVIEGISTKNDLEFMEMEADPESLNSAKLELFYKEYK